MKPKSSVTIHAKLSPKWTKAAVIGSIWAAIEIVAGSFLHNLKIPFSGTILSMAAVYLLVAFSMQWKERGIIIRAGLIAAIMKSISPSAVILGPMVGIFMEAVILEFIWILLGRNIIGFVVGGMVAVSWALVQKTLSLLILYGFDLVRIAEAFYLFLVKNTGLEGVSAIYLLGLVVAVYITAGTAAALAGYFSYRRIERSKGGEALLNTLSAENSSPFGKRPEKQKFAAVNMLAILTLLATALWFLNNSMYLPALLSGGVITIYVLFRYKSSVRYLRKPGLWIQLLLITLLASLLWEWFSTGKFLSAEGLIIGLEMNFRALIIIFSFSAISVELRNPVVRSLLYRNGFSNLYKSVSLAFSTLPGIIERIPKKNNLFRQRRNVLETILQLADELLYLMEKTPPVHHNIFLITGKVHSGKSEYTVRLIEICREQQLNVAGFMAKGTFRDQKRDSFQLVDIESGNSIQLAVSTPVNGWHRFRDFYFNPEALQLGESILTEGLMNGAGLLVLDELGPMELAGDGWSQAISVLEKNYTTPQVWVARERIMKEVTDRWQIPTENIFHIETSSPDDLMSRIKNFRNLQR